MKETAERMPIWEVCLQTAVDIIAKTNYTEQLPMETMGFPGGLTGKESTCNAGDQGSIPGSGRSPGKGYGNLCHSIFLPGKSHSRAWWATVHGVAMSGAWLHAGTLTFHLPSPCSACSLRSVVAVSCEAVSERACTLTCTHC